MPLPSPKPDEEQEPFVNRCMIDPGASKEFPDTQQRLAVCHDQFQEAKATTTSDGEIEEEVAGKKRRKAVRSMEAFRVARWLGGLGGIK